jgi:ribosomal protein S20
LLHKGVSKGIFHKNTASRTISRLAKKLAST